MGHSRYNYDLQSDGRHHFTIEHSQDGKAWTAFMGGVCHCAQFGMFSSPGTLPALRGQFFNFW